MNKKTKRWTSAHTSLVIAALIIAYMFLSKPRQPEGYQRHICAEAAEGAMDRCQSLSNIPNEECDAIVKSTLHMCEGALPEEYAQP